MSDCNAIAEAKRMGKEALTAVKAQITQKCAAALKAKKLKRLRVVAEQKAEKARPSAQSKAKQADAKVCLFFLISTLYSTSLFLRKQCVSQHYKSLKGYLKVNNVSSLLPHHPSPQSQIKMIWPMLASLKTNLCFTMTTQATFKNFALI